MALDVGVFLVWKDHSLLIYHPLKEEGKCSSGHNCYFH